ncbi:MAG: hypothetical protein WBL65_15320 [Bryobacteraceae bacterium]
MNPVSAPVSHGEPHRGRPRRLVLLLGAAAGLYAADPKPVPSPSGTTLVQLVGAIRAKARTLENGAGMKTGFQSFTFAFKLQPDTVSFSDYAVARLLFEATRDAGFWNLHWAVTNLPPNSDNIWLQWKTVNAPSPLAPTATAECDELSALYAFLAGRAGIRGIGLFWPAANHTVAVWVLHQPTGPVRVVVPTTQIFLDETDFWGTKKFDPWRQKAIYEYTRRDVPDTFELPQPLFAFFLQQVDKYAGASDAALQLLRYFREGVFLKGWTPEAAASEALRVRRGRGSGTPEDLAAFQNFAQDMHSEPPRR